MRSLVLTLCVVLTVASAVTAQTLEEIKTLLEPNLTGSWTIEPETNPSIGPMLVYKPHPENTWPGFVGILPFGQDDEGKRKIEFYISTCQAPLYVLGFKTNITVITYLQRTDHTCQKIVDLLHLSLPASTNESGNKTNAEPAGDFETTGVTSPDSRIDRGVVRWR